MMVISYFLRYPNVSFFPDKILGTIYPFIVYIFFFHIHTCIHTYIQTYRHTYIRTYIHTYIQYIYIYIHIHRDTYIYNINRETKAPG